jgi:hypothetical protein
MSPADVPEQLMVLAGHPDVRPGVPVSKVAGLVWTRQHLIESFDDERLVARLVVEQGEYVLAHAVEYRFRDGVLVDFAITDRDEPPDVFGAQKIDRDDRPWPLIDRSVLGYAFRVSPGWRLITRRDLRGNGFDFEMTIVGMTRVHDPELDEWVENSLQWCVFRRPKGFTKIEDVIAAEEKRLKAGGNTIVKRERSTTTPVDIVYHVKFRDRPYVGRTRFAVFDGKGFAIRFNATSGTYAINLPRYERFLRDFKLTNQRPEDPDMDLLRVGDQLVEILGGAATAEELGGRTMETVVPAGRAPDRN